MLPVRAIQVTRHGGPEVLELVELERPVATPGHVVVRVEAAGVNFIDTYQRSGAYPMDLPFVPGKEGAGTIVEVGEGVEHLVEGEGVAWAFTQGSYAEYVSLSVSDVYPVPEDVELDMAAAAMLQGLTAHYLVTSSYAVMPGDAVLVHAAAGGVGLLLTQLAVARGATVIGTVGSDAKERIALQAGASHVLRYDLMDDIATDLPAAVRGIVPEGVAAVYDGVGRTTFDGSLASLHRRGAMVLFGAASGPVEPVDPQRLNSAGSVVLSRPTLADFTAEAEEREWRASDIFHGILLGDLSVRIDRGYSLEEAAEAHRALESRATSGKLLLHP
ncbi:NADPH2:quinone reductase [Demequina mangrovi]|uniref:NADPH2:quinone reductase n=1 Tax=Demequina mangrovi TaxID=1043493 RepID=A0A1H6YWX3_9MICO|nr:quinone oxidoreductase [Demequina mangrovi]SEJ44856.1 NADPH2:quinone reductase [Demequina mangrovi]